MLEALSTTADGSSLEDWKELLTYALRHMDNSKVRKVVEGWPIYSIAPCALHVRSYIHRLAVQRAATEQQAGELVY